MPEGHKRKKEYDGAKRHHRPGPEGQGRVGMGGGVVLRGFSFFLVRCVVVELSLDKNF